MASSVIKQDRPVEIGPFHIRAMTKMQDPLTREMREDAIRAVLANQAMLELAGERPTWAKMLKGVTVNGQQVLADAMLDWLHSEWGMAIRRQWFSRMRETMEDKLLMDLGHTVQVQLNIAANEADPESASRAFDRVWKVAEALNVVDTLSAARGQGVQQLLMQFSGNVTLNIGEGGVVHQQEAIDADSVTVLSPDPAPE